MRNSLLAIANITVSGISMPGYIRTLETCSPTNKLCNIHAKPLLWCTGLRYFETETCDAGNKSENKSSRQKKLKECELNLYAVFSRFLNYSNSKILHFSQSFIHEETRSFYFLTGFLIRGVKFKLFEKI